MPARTPMPTKEERAAAESKASREYADRQAEDARERRRIKAGMKTEAFKLRTDLADEITAPQQSQQTPVLRTPIDGKRYR